MQCSKCGSENGPNNRFCLQCGAPLDVTCPSCGHSVAPGVRFCPNCGQRVGGAPASQPAAPTSATMTAPVAPAAPAASPGAYDGRATFAPPPSATYAPPPPAAPVYTPPPSAAPAYTPPPLAPAASSYMPPPLAPAAPAYTPPPPAPSYAAPAGGFAPPAYPAAAAMQYRGVWPRFFATLVDAILLGVPLSYLLGSFIVGKTITADKYDITKMLVPYIIIVAVYLIYAIVLEAGGGTLGKRVLGMRVVDSAGNKPGYGRSVARNLLRLIDLLPIFYILGALMVAKTAKKQRVGDKAAGTYVIKRQRAR